MRTLPLPLLEKKANQISLISVGLGLALALLVTPNDTMSPHQMTIPAAILALSLFTGMLYEVLQGGIERAMQPKYVIAASVVYFVLLDPLQGLYILEVPRPVVLMALGAISLFMASVFAGSMKRPPRLPRTVALSVGRTYGTQLVIAAAVLCFLLGMFYYAWSCRFDLRLMIRGLSMARYEAPWTRNTVGNKTSVVQHLTYFGYLLPTLTVVLALRLKSWLRLEVLLVTILTGTQMAFLAQGGGRRVIGMCAGAALFTWICTQRRRLKLRHYIQLALAVGAILFFLDLMLQNRNRGAKRFDVDVNQLQGIRVDDNFLRLAQILQIFPDSHPHTKTDWLIWVLARPIPRFLWPEKPLTPGFDLAVYLGKEGMTLSISCVGEVFAAFGWAGIVGFGLFCGWLSSFWFQVLVRRDTSDSGIGLYGLGVMAMAISVRAVFELILMSYPLLGWFAIDYAVLRYAALKKAKQDAARLSGPSMQEA